ncbi:hypothetical protein [Gracilibacillus saliphilus]|uniref:hypothetical protein n=1 Tax=Gracilibacillus saliphilus TaxID=543890 RepID=UPI0013D57B61|nr:hypothetical protein [Gracilibacillus saliphilus]
MKELNIQSLELTDSVFKNLDHCVGKLIIESNDKNLIKGYSPDLSIKNEKGDLVYILENERKIFLGDVDKAAYYCDIYGNTTVLIIIMKETSNQTTVLQMSQLHCDLEVLEMDWDQLLSSIKSKMRKTYS